jgi:hypothetical protein
VARPCVLGCRIASSPAHSHTVACCVPRCARCRPHKHVEHHAPARTFALALGRTRAVRAMPRNLPARCVGLRASAACVGRASVPLPGATVYRTLVYTGYCSITWRRDTRERSRADPSGADGAPQRRTEICHTENEKPICCTCPSPQSKSHAVAPRCPKRKYDFVLLPTLFRHKSLMHVHTSVLKHAAASHHMSELRS